VTRLDVTGTRERVTEILCARLAIEVERPDQDIVQDGLLDSLALVTLLLEIEEEFGVTVPMETLELEWVSSVDRIAELVLRLQGEPTPGLRGSA
jgi:acyl carrier protein